jgi:TPR repeat protein
MSARIRPLLSVLVLACCLGTAAAQDKPVDIDALKAQAKEGSTRAMRRLAEMYYAGLGGVEQDFKQALSWYQMLANRKDRRGMTALGTMYARGYGVEKSSERAHAWWLASATSSQGGDAGAMYNLGTLYFQGEGVAQDYGQAAEWYRRAASVGHIQAQHNVAMMYHEGKGVTRDPERAYFWMKVAALLGDDESEQALKRVGQGLSGRQVRHAESEAAAWMKRYKKIVGD